MEDAPEITPVRSAHRIDESALEAYLHSQSAEFSGSLKVQQFEGGQSNPTYHLTVGGRPYVLRKKPSGEIFHAGPNNMSPPKEKGSNLFSLYSK